MKVELKDVLHYYSGCNVVYANREFTMFMYDVWNDEAHIDCVDDSGEVHIVGPDAIKPILRQYKDMNSDDAIKMFDHFHPDEIEKHGRQYKINYMQLLLPYREAERVSEVQVTPRFMHYLLKQGFDLFGLIESGQAIDTQSLTTKQQP